MGASRGAIVCAESGIISSVADDGENGPRRDGNRGLRLDSAIHISKDGMEARAIMPPPTNPEANTDPADVVLWLNACGLTRGHCLEAIAEALAGTRVSGTALEEVVVACGTPPISGEDARVELCFAAAPSAGTVDEEGGEIDYHERGFLHAVKEGDLLARKIPATAGEPGSDLFGKAIASKPGKDLRLEAKAGAELSEDGLECHAAVDGVVVAIGGTAIGVVQQFTIPGDVDLHTGNLEMNGSLIIQGWVREGFRVHATGDLVINGGIEPSQVKTEANLVVKGGIVGGPQSSVESQGAVSAQFLEAAQLRAGGDVQVHNGILNSQVTAEGHVSTTEGKGYIVGGVLRATKGVEVNELGSPAGVRTIVDVGVDSETRGKLGRLERECALYERNQQKITRGLATLITKARSGILMPSEKAALGKLVRLRREAELTRRTMANCWKQLDRASATVKVRKAVYEGATVIAFGHRIDVQENVPIPGEFVLNIEEDRLAYLAERQVPPKQG